MWLGNWHRLKRRTRRQTLRGRQCQKADRSWRNWQFQKRTGDEFRDGNGCVKWRREEMHMLPFEVQKRPTWEEELCLASTHRGNSLAWESNSVLLCSLFFFVTKPFYEYEIIQSNVQFCISLIKSRNISINQRLVYYLWEKPVVIIYRKLGFLGYDMKRTFP